MPNETASPSPKQRKRRAWLGVIGGIISKFGASTLLLGTALVGGRIWAELVGAQHSGTEHMADAISPGWFLLQAINFVSAVLGGWVCAWLSPPRAVIAPAILLLLALAASAFAQLPPTQSPWLIGLWALGAPLGIAAGVALHWRHER